MPSNTDPIVYFWAAGIVIGALGLIVVVLLALGEATRNIRNKKINEEGIKAQLVEDAS